MAYNTQILGGTANPYNAGALVVNTEEPVKYFLAQKAHQAALDEAATKSALDKINDFKPDKIRAVDTPELLNITNRYTSNAIKNKAAINNLSIDGGKSYLSLKDDYNKGLLHSTKSKAAQAEEVKVAQLSLLDQKAGRKIEPENVELISRIEAPITDPRHYKDGAAMTQPYTSADWKPYQGYGAKEQEAQLKLYSPTLNDNNAFDVDGKSVSSIDPNTGRKVTIDPYRISKKGINQMQNIFDADYNGNPSTQTHAKDAFEIIGNELTQAGNSPTLLKLNETYKEFVGKNLDPTNLKEIGFAQLLSKTATQLKGVEYNDAGTLIKPDKFYEHELWKMRNRNLGDGENNVNNIIDKGVTVRTFRLPNEGDKNDKGTYYEGYKEVKLDIPIAERFTPKELDKDGKLIKNPSTRWLVSENGTKFAPVETVTEEDKKRLDEEGKGSNIKVGDIKIPKPTDWVDKSQIAQAYLKEYPKGEGNLKANTPRVRQEASTQTTKQVPLTVIKSKVGTKGYEGYTEKELVDYYTSQGYNIQK